MSDDPRALYIDLVKKSLTCSLYEGYDGTLFKPRGSWRRALLRQLVPDDVRLVRRAPDEQRAEGKDWPALALSMVGTKRLDNLHACIETVLRDGVPGDLIETGVWRGGSCILMRAILKAHGVTDRSVFVADSFEGLPKPDAARLPRGCGGPALYLRRACGFLGAGSRQFRALRASRWPSALPQGLVQGHASDPLPIERLAVARLDGDMYESTMDAIEALYPKLEPGGFLIMDDYGAVPACKQATEDYRKPSRHPRAPLSGSTGPAFSGANRNSTRRPFPTSSRLRIRRGFPRPTACHP
jgi:O-methyltransferase